MFVFAYAWHVLLRIHRQELPLFKSVYYFFLSQLGKYIPGKVWTISGRIGLCVREGLDPPQSSSAVIYEQLMLLIASSTIGVLGGFFWLHEVSSFSLPALLILTPVVFSIAHPYVVQHLIFIVCRLVKREPFIINMSGRVYLSVLLLYAAGHVALGMSFFFAIGILTELPFQISPFVTCVFAASWAVGYASLLAPAGFGVREGLLLALLESVIAPEILVAAVVLHRLFSVSVDLFCTSSIFILDVVYKRKLSARGYHQDLDK